MSKIYLYDGKAYTEEKIIKKFNNFNSGYSNNPVLVYELSEVVDLKEFVTGIQKQKERDMQLTVLLDESDEYTNMISFISIYKKYVESDDVLAKNPSWTIENSKKHDILRKFKEIGLDNCKFGNLLKREREYFLNEVDNSIEYFTAYLKINSCTLNFFKTKKTYDYSTWGGRKIIYTKVDRFNLSDETKSNFKESKKNLLDDKKMQ
jgi:hypothetical protein